jgi:hypothetical protein
VIPVYSSDTIPTTSIGEIQTRMQNVARYFDECSYSQYLSLVQLLDGYDLMLQWTPTQIHRASVAWNMAV